MQDRFKDSTFPPMQGTEEKEAHLRHSKAAHAIEFNIKYPASEP